MARRSSPAGAPSLFGETAAAAATPERREKPLLLLMDGHAMVFRAWFALRQAQPLTIRETGEDVRGVYSFTTTFFKTLADHRPTHVAIAFDPPGAYVPPRGIRRLQGDPPRYPPRASPATSSA